jgi:hypothetical protein
MPLPKTPIHSCHAPQSTIELVIARYCICSESAVVKLAQPDTGAPLRKFGIGRGVSSPPAIAREGPHSHDFRALGYHAITAALGCAMTSSQRMRERAVMISSTMPSPHPPRCARHPLPQCGRGAPEDRYPVLLPRKRRDGRAEPQAGWKTSVRTSMLSRGRASGGVVGSVNEVCGMKRAGMSVRVSAIFNSSASSRLISGT